MSTRLKIALHVIAPVSAWLVLSGMYFSRHTVLQRLVSPKLPPLAINTWREFGLLENLQNLLLLSMIGIAIRGAILAGAGSRRICLALAACLALFVFLEEVDYGTLWVSYARAAPIEWFQPEAEWPPELSEAGRRADAFNLHFAGRRFRWMKAGADAVTVVLFLVIPLVVATVGRAKWIASWAPDRWMVATVLIAAGLRRLTHAVARWEQRALDSVTAAGGMGWELGSLRSNLSEFGELLLYTCFFLYLVQQVYARKSVGGG